MDMLAGDICELRPDGGIRRQHVGTIAAMIRPRREGGFVVATERGLVLADDDDLDARSHTLPDIITDSGVRMNEGGCDPAGNLYVGTMAHDSSPARGTLYRIDSAHSSTVAESGVTISNGIDWSPDGRSCYYVDSPTQRIDQYDWSPSGLSNRRPLADVVGTGAADGLTVDADGNIWTAIFGGSEVRCYSPTGRLEQVVGLPVRQVTAVAFVGEQLDTLIITTSRYGLVDPEPQAGAIFTCHPGVRGQTTRPYAG